MSNRKSTERAQELLQQAEVLYQKNADGEMMRGVSALAQAYYSASTAADTDSGLTIWFTATKDNVTPFKQNFEVQTVMDGTTPGTNDITWTFDTNLSPAPTAHGLTASHTYPSSQAGKAVEVKVAYTGSGAPANAFARYVSIPAT